MAVAEWGSLKRWLLVKRADQWFLDCPLEKRPTFTVEHFFSNFAEAHAAYLDAVTCDSTYDATKVKSVGRIVRCVKARGHEDRWHECPTGGWTRDNSGAVFVS